MEREALLTAPEKKNRNFKDNLNSSGQKSPAIDGQLKFWQETLSGYEYLNLPTERARPAQMTKSGSYVSFSIEEETSSLLAITSRELEVSLESLLLSGFYLMLVGFSNQKDIIIGTLAGIGHRSANPLALRAVIDPDQSVLDFIVRVNRSLAAAYHHSELPFTTLLSALGEVREQSRHPIFQVMFGLDSQDVSHSYYSDSGCDIAVRLLEHEEDISGHLYYSDALFEEKSIGYFISTFKHVLVQIAGLNSIPQNNMKIKELSYLAEDGYERCIKKWNDTVKPYPSDKTIHHLFEEQVAKSPDSPAIIFEGVTLTYAELNQRANKLACWLRQECGVGPDDLVVLCLDRSEMMPEAVLAVLKAGGAYVPVDPDYPVDRIDFILGDTKAKVVLTQCLYAGKLTMQPGARSVSLDDPLFRKQLDVLDGTNLKSLVTAQNLAYVIYTSGTTGKPKGAMLQHQGIVNRIVWMNDEYPLHASDRILQKTPYVFDVSVWELFWAHWYGAAIVYARPGGQKDNNYLAELIYKEKITVIHFVPSMLGVFEEALENDSSLRLQVETLRYLFCSGEALPLSMVRKAHELLPQTEIHNLYGPTEASVDVLYYDCNDRNIASVPIGKPIANTTMYILDEFLRPGPIGGIGELYIGGDGLARGYLNRPELTTERFIVNPFQTEEEQLQLRNERLYKTGDLARYRHDGNIEYLGRNDFQVKIRGFRIELGEIETRIAACKGVKHVAVLAGEKNGSAYLVAYYVADDAVKKEHIMSTLAKELPEYMIPTAWVRLQGLPQTINGKLDRRALPEPDFSTGEKYRAPENKEQEELCEIYGQVLEIAPTSIGVDDDFFLLGGSSILAIRLLGQVNRHFDAKLTVADIFVEKTISRLAARLQAGDNHQSGVVRLNDGAGADNLFMIHPGNAGCEVYISLARRLAGRFDCYGVDSHNMYKDGIISDLSLLATQYLDLIENVQKKTGSGHYNLLGWSLGGQLALEIAAILEGRGVKKIRLYLLDTIIVDERLDTLGAELVEEKLAYVTGQLGGLFGDEGLIRRYLNAQIDVSRQQISNKLRHTHVSLFKAMLPDSVLKGENARLSTEHILGLWANNVDQCIARPDVQLNIIPLKESDHYNLLKEEEVLVDEMVKPKPAQAEMKSSTIKPEAWLILAALTLIWGSSFILIKKGLDGFSPMQVGSLRICFAGLVLLPIALRNIRTIPKKALFYSVLFGLLNSGLPAFLFPIAETKVDSATAGILNGLTPIFTLIVGLSFFGMPFNIFKLVGVVVGFLGATMLILFRDGFDKPAHLRDTQLGYSLLLVLATCLYGFAGNVMKRHLDNVRGPVIAAFAFGSFAIPSAIYLAFSDFGHRLATVPAALSSLSFIAILGVFGSAIAVILSSRLLKLSNALFASFVTYLIPFVAIAWGAADNEQLGLVPFVSLGVILAAIYISRMNRGHLSSFKLGNSKNKK